MTNNLYTNLLALLLHQLDFQLSQDLQNGVITKNEYIRILETKKLELVLKYQNHLNQEVN